MNNKLEVIGIDHGWSMMKTIFQVFVTGVKEITTSPALFGDVLEYEGKFYKVGTVRQEVKDTKVEDEQMNNRPKKEHKKIPPNLKTNSEGNLGYNKITHPNIVFFIW